MKLLSILLSFLRDLIFESKDEYNFKSLKFNTRKVSVLLIVVFSLAVNVILVNRVISIAKDNLELRQFIKDYTNDCYKTPDPSSLDVTPGMIKVLDEQN